MLLQDLTPDTDLHEHRGSATTKPAATCSALRMLLQDLCFWSWNANSGDTGGLVDSDTWTQVQWEKITWMQQAMGLKPWYQVATGAAKPTPSPPAVC